MKYRKTRCWVNNPILEGRSEPITDRSCRVVTNTLIASGKSVKLRRDGTVKGRRKTRWFLSFSGIRLSPRNLPNALHKAARLATKLQQEVDRMVLCRDEYDEYIYDNELEVGQELHEAKMARDFFDERRLSILTHMLNVTLTLMRALCNDLGESSSLRDKGPLLFKIEGPGYRYMVLDGHAGSAQGPHRNFVEIVNPVLNLEDHICSPF